MSDFSTVVKYLRLTAVRKVTPDEAEAAQQLNGSSNPLKYLTIVPSRPIQLIESNIIIPSFVPDTSTDSQYWITGRLLFQFDCPFGVPFFILNAPIVNTRQWGVLCVKFRVGTTVTRYAIYGNQLSKDSHIYDSVKHNLLYIPWYNNELILPNCVFEYWFDIRPTIVKGTEYALPNGYVIKCSNLSLPQTADQTGINIATNNVLQVADLGVSLPETLPYNQANIVYNSN